MSLAVALWRHSVSAAVVIVVFLAALWAVECNRMVRASFYIAYVSWPRMCKALGEALKQARLNAGLSLEEAEKLSRIAMERLDRKRISRALGLAIKEAREKRLHPIEAEIDDPRIQRAETRQDGVNAAHGMGSRTQLIPTPSPAVMAGLGPGHDVEK